MARTSRSTDINKPDLDETKAAAKAAGLSISEFVERIVIDYLDGKVMVPAPAPPPTVVRTSFTMDEALIAKLNARLAAAPQHERLPSIIRSWLNQQEGTHD